MKMRIVRSAALAYAVGVAAALSLGALPACSKGDTKATREPEAKLPVVRDDAAGQIFTYIDDKGAFLVESNPSKVPEASREHVRVMDASTEPPEGQVFLVDLRTKRPDGTYAVTLGQRAAFDAVAEGRRKALAVAQAPSGSPAGGDKVVPAQVAVVVYGASWCGACQKTRAYLKKKNIPFVDKDIDEDSSAAREMRAKLSKAGMRSQGIPVIDVGGKLMVGFDPGAIDRALAGG
jgi:glutaredoxin